MSDHMEANRNSIVFDRSVSLAPRSSLRFYVNEVSKFMIMPVQFSKACFDLFLKWWRD
ncbi:hypothetical protein SLEP1_g16072 [Rubroshorea leprosula]|uniref:Uncharacterized protein n=1 Tax=Rubroshorea leprosula TaxID=152421 RepID=A0AAV5IVB3_9ROSI|nr:hypothetical protein SLEP1_g16072 [Rubroshorea leprosula]